MMQSPKMAKAWTLGFVASGHEWIVSNCAEPVDELPEVHQLLRLMFVLKLKEVDGVQVPHVRPVVTEYTRNSDSENFLKPLNFLTLCENFLRKLRKISIFFRKR
eukprot:jgi/Mesvir1/7208/Mv25797-RA.1